MARVAGQRRAMNRARAALPHAERNAGHATHLTGERHARCGTASPARRCTAGRLQAMRRTETRIQNTGLRAS